MVFKSFEKIIEVVLKCKVYVNLYKFTDYIVKILIETILIILLTVCASEAAFLATQQRIAIT